MSAFLVEYPYDTYSISKPDDNKTQEKAKKPKHFPPPLRHDAKSMDKRMHLRPSIAFLCLFLYHRTNMNGILPSSEAFNHAHQEKAEHMEGMEHVVSAMRAKPLQILAYSVENAPKQSSNPLKTVHFVRHGQGFHNLMADIAREQGRSWVSNVKSPENPYTAPEIVDAPLTEKGRQQALLLQSRIAALPRAPELVVLSPNCRALQTGLLAFESLLPSVPGEPGKARFMAHEMVREEHGVHYCDQRRPVSRQSREFPYVDFSLLESDEDILFQEDMRETKLQVGERVYQFMEWLSKRSECHVAVSSHSAWLLTVFNGVCQSQDDSLDEWFSTGEMRSVVLEFVY